MPPAPSRRLSRRGPGIVNPSLEAASAALEALGHPERAFASILVAGTNGKGSTAAMLSAMLEAHGVATGLYTSPHLVRVEERIRIRGREVASETLDAAIAALDPFPDLSYFETLTVAAFGLFARQAVDVAVLEAGMGGRWDATRLAGPAVAGLTNVGTDHARWLGPDRAAIAAEKGAALAAARTAVLGPEVDAAVRGVLGVPGAVDAGELVRCRTLDDRRVEADWRAGPVTLHCPLAGRHQHRNLHLALALHVAASREGLVPPPEPAAVRDGLARTLWPGRLGAVRLRGREVLLDGAHNAEAAAALAAHLRALGRRPDLIFSCLDDKPAAAMLTALRPVVGRIVLVALDDPRAMPLAALRKAAPDGVPAANLDEALELARDPVLAAGSLRLVGALLARAVPGESS